MAVIKTPQKPHIVTSVGEDVERLEPSHAAGGNVKCYSGVGKQSSGASEGETWR